MGSKIVEMGINQLSIQEKMSLIGEIWDSLDLASLPIPEAHLRELDKRLEIADQMPEALRSWEEVRERIWSRE